VIASAKAAWGVAGIMAVALAGVGYQYASRSGNLSEQTASFENERNALQTRLIAIEKEAETLEGRFRDRESEFGQSQRQAAEREKASRGETGRLQTSLRDADRFLSEFRDALTTSNQRIEALQAQSASATERLKETESRLEETRIQLSHAESSLQQVEARLLDRESEFGQSQRQAAEREKASRGETGRLRTSLRDADRFLSEFRDALTTSNQRIEALQAQSASATERLKETESRLEETRIQLSHAESSLQQVEARFRDRESEFGQSQRQAAEREKASRGETDRLRTSLRDADRFLSEFRDALTTSNQKEVRKRKDMTYNGTGKT
jgi:chromosome segregation ATPase